MIILPSQVVFTLKDQGKKKKTRLAACGNLEGETPNQTKTNELDQTMFKTLVAWSASRKGSTVGSIDITTAFLNATLPPNCIVVLRAPWALTRTGHIKSDEYLLLKRAVYGLRDSPKL